LAEFALVLPLVLMFIGGIVEMGRAWNIKQAVTDAAREGARYTVVMDPDMSLAQVEAKIEERLLNASIENSTVVISSPDPSCAAVADCFHMENGFGYGKEMTVSVSTQYKLGLIGALLSWAGAPAEVTIATATTMRNE